MSFPIGSSDSTSRICLISDNAGGEGDISTASGVDNVGYQCCDDEGAAGDSRGASSVALSVLGIDNPASNGVCNPCILRRTLSNTSVWSQIQAVSTCYDDLSICQSPWKRNYPDLFRLFNTIWAPLSLCISNSRAFYTRDFVATLLGSKSSEEDEGLLQLFCLVQGGSNSGKGVDLGMAPGVLSTLIYNAKYSQPEDNSECCGGSECCLGLLNRIASIFKRNQITDNSEDRLNFESNINGLETQWGNLILLLALEILGVNIDSLLAAEKVAIPSISNIQFACQDVSRLLSKICDLCTLDVFCAAATSSRFVATHTLWRECLLEGLSSVNVEVSPQMLTEKVFMRGIPGRLSAALNMEMVAAILVNLSTCIEDKRGCANPLGVSLVSRVLYDLGAVLTKAVEKNQEIVVDFRTLLELLVIILFWHGCDVTSMRCFGTSSLEEREDISSLMACISTQLDSNLQTEDSRSIGPNNPFAEIAMSLMGSTGSRD
ncbi:hypothetical protein CP10139811_0005 [Chlamydia ibidis]|uniref:Uncharacterized protein n=2 Tax=Chlamydia ibidis TaxID=1405396 RepID=S7KHK1_9CHLA|nr:hypothetical protein [Chlamydia ibidis]EPP35646.1 hypothetical protein CP10139811_0005 [Chlamydia ibidis]EQM62777.1 hypothetical protein H359_0450 [Chlamydia ibidis 10-1398/6]